MKNSIAITGGHLIDPANNRNDKFNIIIENGIISEVTQENPPARMETIDATGKIVTPGFIDLHVHLREPGFENKEDIESGSKAAAAGGFTSIFCMPNTKPACDNIETIRLINKRASECSSVEIYPVGAMSKGLQGKELTDLEGMAKEGVIAISDDGSCIQNAELMKEAMHKAKELDLLVISHPEDFSISKGGVMNAGALAEQLGLKGIPPEAEENIIERDIKLARETGARLHIAHTSTAKGIELVRQAKAEGLKVTCEVTPHHLLLTEEACKDLNPNTKMNPPLRREADRQALIKGLQDKTVTAIATDHAPHALNEKFSEDISPSLEGRGKGRVISNFISAPFGIIGMETALPVCMKLVEENLITLERLIELFTIGPASVVKSSHSCESRNPANITIFDINQEYKIDPSKL